MMTKKLLSLALLTVTATASLSLNATDALQVQPTRPSFEQLENSSKITVTLEIERSEDTQAWHQITSIADQILTELQQRSSATPYKRELLSLLASLYNCLEQTPSLHGSITLSAK